MPSSRQITFRELPVRRKARTVNLSFQSSIRNECSRFSLQYCHVGKPSQQATKKEPRKSRGLRRTCHTFQFFKEPGLRPLSDLQSTINHTVCQYNISMGLSDRPNRYSNEPRIGNNSRNALRRIQGELVGLFTWGERDRHPTSGEPRGTAGSSLNRP
jgi:hypothetical protein